MPSPNEPVVAVVGSRTAGPAGLAKAHRIGLALGRAGAWVVSGGAAGIDAAAHAGAIEAGGRTVVVLGGGLDHLYPAGNRELFARVVESGGGLAAEVEDDQRAASWSFPRRNRIVAALGRATVVVRAGAHSGALGTAEHAARLGLPVFVAAGVTGEEGEGLRALARAGAVGFGTVEELLAVLGLGIVPAQGAVDAGPESLYGETAALWRALGSEPRGADEVARRSGVGSGAVLAGLMELELLGLVERRPGRGYARREVGSEGE